MRKKLKDNDPIFDGFAHRGFREDMDGWLNEQPDAHDYPALQNAYDTLAMFEEIKVLRRQLWYYRDAERKLGQIVYGEKYEGADFK
jgi:hypothetical protein